MAADVGADMDRSDFALRQLDRGKNRALRTSGAKIRRPRRDVAERGDSARAMRDNFFDLARNCVGIDAGRPRRGDEGGNAAQHNLRSVIAARWQAAFAVDARICAGAAQYDVDLLLDKIGRALFRHQHGALAGAEFLHLFRHQRISDVEDVDGDARGAVEIGKIEPRQRAQQAVGQAAENDDADISEFAGADLVELLLANEFARSRQALLDFQPLLREDHRRMGKPAIFEAWRPGELMLGAVAAALIVFGDKLPGHVTRAHPQVEHDRRVAYFR